MKRKNLGLQGEQTATSLLRKKGYKILNRNFHCHFGELDIVAEKKGQIVFVEVRGRHSTDFGLPEQSLNYPKRRRLSKLALYYLSLYGLQEKPCRFDVIAIQWEKDKVKSIRHIKNAFEATF